MRDMARWSRVDLGLGSILKAAADHCLGSFLFTGLDLDGFDGSSPPIVSFHPLHFCPCPTIACWVLWACTAIPFLGSPRFTTCLCSLSLTFRVLFVSPTYVGLAAVFPWHFVHDPFSPLVHVSSLSLGSHVVSLLV